ncbi:MAG TPA: lysophospholipid acyltransferase family protein [Gemmatimonadales bacterium]|nr:lysophospholipid acyltransferase family protein [Gemmatimonadales bacterium]
MRLRIPPGVVARLAPPLLGGLASTWRYDTPLHPLAPDVKARRQAAVIVCWHEELLPLLWRHRHLGIAVVVSVARDGQYLADAAERLGYRLVRGSSRRHRTQALLGAYRALEEGTSVCFTPDGPVGPRRVAKPGAVAAAQKAGVPILPLRAEVSRAWRFRSWDRFVLPKPFARISVRYGEPFHVAEGPAGLEEGIRRMQEALNLLGPVA